MRTRRSDVSAKIGYGIAGNADLELELPYVREVTDGAVAQGRGDASLSVKWRFHESAWCSSPICCSRAAATSSAWAQAGCAGRPTSGAYEAGKLELLAHLGYTHNRNRLGERRSLWHASAAALYSLTDKLRLLADYGRDSEPDPAAGSHGREWVVGATYALSERIDLGVGVKNGLNDAADDRSLRAGVKLRW